MTCQWINGAYLLGLKFGGRAGHVQQNLHSWWTEKIAKPISKIDDFVKHVCREHNQEADHWANIGAQEHRKIVLDRCGNSESWKSVKGNWDGSAKDNGKSSFLLSMAKVTKWYSSSVLFSLRSLIQSSLPAPVHCNFIVHIPTIMQSPPMLPSCMISVRKECHHLVLLHLLTFSRVSITAMDFSSQQVHSMARHILSAVTSYRKSKSICIHIFLATYHCLGLPPLDLVEG